MAVDLNATANIMLNAYGMTPMNVRLSILLAPSSQDLIPFLVYVRCLFCPPRSAMSVTTVQLYRCVFLEFCPTYAKINPNLGSAFVPLPASLQLPIPSIAFSIPDLEAVAQLKLLRVETGEVAGNHQSIIASFKKIIDPFRSLYSINPG